VFDNHTWQSNLATHIKHAWNDHPEEASGKSWGFITAKASIVKPLVHVLAGNLTSSGFRCDQSRFSVILRTSIAPTYFTSGLSSMKIAGLQMRTTLGDVAKNLEKIRHYAHEAAASGAKLLIVPELALCGYGAGKLLNATAEPSCGPSAEALTAIASTAGIAIVSGLVEAADAKCFNSALYVSGRGQTAIYRKTNLFAAYERTWFEAAEPSCVTADLDGLKLGFLICYDVEFPENVRRLALAGVDLIVVPTALPQGPSADFIVDHMIKVRAFENQVHVAYINNVGSSGAYTFAGRSQIAAPDGSVLAEANFEDEMLIYADIFSSKIRPVVAGKHLFG
jgi:5-aminopentanamidase